MRTVTCADASKMAAAVVAAFVIAGCRWNVAMTPAANQVAASRLVGLPSVGTSSVRDDAKQWRAHDEEAALAREQFDRSVNYALSRSDARFFAGQTLTLLQRYPAFRAWSDSALREVLLQILARRTAAAKQPPTPEKRLEKWSFPGDLEPWRRVLDADFVLLTRFSEAYAPDGTKLRPAWDTGINWTIGCVLRLEDGVLVWCSVHHTAQLNLATRKGAQKAVDRLLERMLARMPIIEPRTSFDPPSAAGPDGGDQLED